jgi:hypothetical protein
MMAMSPSPAAGSFCIVDLQAYLRQFPSKHYSCEGRDPLMYVSVLLLSLQFKAALHYMLNDPAAAAYRVCDVPSMLPECSLNVPSMFPQWFLNGAWTVPERFLNR